MNSQQFKRYETDAEQLWVLLQLNPAKKKVPVGFTMSDSVQM
jgi:hypothetical protein